MGYRRQSPQPVVEGGTGKQTFTAYTVLCAGTGAGPVSTQLQSVSSVGTSGQVLTSNGAGALPTFQPVSGGVSVITLTGDSGGPISPLVGDIKILGSGSISVAGDALNHKLTITPGSTIPTSFQTDSGIATPNANILNIKANPAIQTCGRTVSFSAPGSSNTVQLNVSDGNQNTLIGLGSGGAIVSGLFNTALGYGAANSVSSGSGNTVIGAGSADLLTSGDNNTIFGATAASIMTTASNNIIIGESAASSLKTGTSNVLIGQNAGFALSSNESSNIFINSSGTIADTNTLRLGSAFGTGNRQLNRAFIQGIRGVTPAAGNAIPVVIDSNGQLGTEGAGGSGPAFFAYLNNNQSLSNNVLTTIVFDTLLNNRDGGYNTGTGIFTAPETGLYMFNVTVGYNGSGGASGQGFAQLTTSNGTFIIALSLYTNIRTLATDPVRLIIGNSCYASLTAGDTVRAQVNVSWGGSGPTAVGFASLGNICTYFGGQLV